ncbi:MAG: PD-(D/E)XK nuclease family protein [Anaerolineae bacterium]
MTVEIFLAPAGGGKTTCVIDAIRALPPLTSVCALVPDQMQATAFRRRLAKAGGALGVEVQTFYKLYADVLALAEGAATPPQAKPEQGMARLLPSVRYKLIQHIARTLSDAGQLPYYAPLRHSAGFARLLGGLFGELKRARIFPEDLEHTLAKRKPRLAELSHLYTAYQSWLLDTGWVDAEGQGWLAAIALEQDPLLFSNLSLLIVDGFDEFNPTQLHLLRLLADRAVTTLVTLTGDPQNPDRLAHRRLARARTALTQALNVEPTSLSDKGQGNKETSRQGDHSLVSLSTCSLAYIEANLFEPNSPPVPAGDAVTFIEAQNRAAEAREALRWLKARLVRDRVSPSDVAVIARDVLPYRPFLEEVAAEFGMVLRFASGADLRTNPAIAAMLNLLTLPLEPDDWSPRALFDALTSPYFDWTGCGLHPGDTGRLYDVAYAGQVISGLDQWREAFQHLSTRTSEEDVFAVVDEDDLAPRRSLATAQVTRLEAVFEEIVTWITPSPQATLRERVMWIEELIGKDPTLTPRSTQSIDDETSLHIVIRARENLATAERDVAALRIFKDILRGLVLADSVLDGGQEINLPLNQFVTELIQAVGETTYTTPVEGEAILVASALKVRGLVFDSVALLGLSEGDFPRAEREDALLRESDRDWLAERGFAIEPRLQGDEATLFYQAVTRARRRLLLCRPYLADDGQPWEASPYWSVVLRLFEDAPVTHVRPTDPVNDVASEQELASAIPADAARVPVTILHARSQTQTDPSPWNGDLSTLEEQLEQRFASGQPWSSSRLETYAKCPFYFWAAYAMELEPRELPQAGFDVLILGSIYHLVLEQLYDRVNDGDPDRLRAELPIVARQVYNAAPSEYGFRPTPLWQRQREEMTEVLHHTLDALIENAGEYKPLIQELAFGLREQPPLILQGKQEQTLHLRGYIDRVDRAPDGRLRIIDYKAGSTLIPARDLTTGHRLQLPLYALAAQEALNTEVAGGFYWHIGSSRPSSLKLEKYEGGVVGAIETAVDYALAIGSAVRAGQFAPLASDDGCPTFCPAATFCERYKPKSW